MSRTTFYDHGEYYPGEPYEFWAPFWNDDPKEHLWYRCFRGGCRGKACLVSDRRTHNAYHNRMGH